MYIYSLERTITSISFSFFDPQGVENFRLLEGAKFMKIQSLSNKVFPFKMLKLINVYVDFILLTTELAVQSTRKKIT